MNATMKKEFIQIMFGYTSYVVQTCQSYEQIICTYIDLFTKFTNQVYQKAKKSELKIL